MLDIGLTDSDSSMIRPNRPTLAYFTKDIIAVSFVSARPDARLSTSYAAFGQLGPERASTGEHVTRSGPNVAFLFLVVRPGAPRSLGASCC